MDNNTITQIDRIYNETHLIYIYVIIMFALIGCAICMKITILCAIGPSSHA